MKKLASLFLIMLFIITFSACKGKEEKLPSLSANVPFSSRISINYGSLAAEGVLTYHNRASAVLEMSAPESLAGLVFTLEEDRISASYKGISFPLSEIGSTAQSVADIIFSAILKSENQTNLKTQGDEFIVSGETHGNDFEIRFDKKSGAITKIESKVLKFSAHFSDFKFLG